MIDVGIATTDVRALAKLHMRAFPKHFLSTLGEDFLVQVYSGFVNDPTAIALVERDSMGNPVGIAVGTVDPVGFFGRLLRRRLTGFVRASIAASVRSPSVIPRLLKATRYRGGAPDGHPGALLSSICVDPVQSGRGIGSVLLQGWLDQARAMGASRAFLATDAEENHAVNDWYARQGWVLTNTYISAGVRAMNRYEYCLLEMGLQ